MPLILSTTGGARPGIFVVDNVRMLGCDFNVAVPEGGGAFACPIQLAER